MLWRSSWLGYRLRYVRIEFIHVANLVCFNLVNRDSFRTFFRGDGCSDIFLLTIFEFCLGRTLLICDPLLPLAMPFICMYMHMQLEVSNDEVLALQSQARTSGEKEHHWSEELSQTSAQLHLAKERAEQLEREGREKSKNIEELKLKLVSAQRIQHFHEQEVSQISLSLSLFLFLHPHPFIRIILRSRSRTCTCVTCIVVLKCK